MRQSPRVRRNSPVFESVRNYQVTNTVAEASPLGELHYADRGDELDHADWLDARLE